MMGEAVVLVANDGGAVDNDGASAADVVDIYPLNGYYFGSKDAFALKQETIADRLQRLKINYEARGLRTCVHAVILVELFKHPHLLLLQVRNTTFKLPGGRLRPGESDIEGLRRKLSRKLSIDEARDETYWEVSDCLGMWWRLDFETLFYPYLPPNSKKPKECAKIFLVKLPVSRKFIVPKNMKLLAVPLCQLHENHKVRAKFCSRGIFRVNILFWAISIETYGSIIAGIPQLLSKFSFNMIET